MTRERKFLKGGRHCRPCALAPRRILHAQEPIRWRFKNPMPGSALGERWTNPIDAINAAATRRA